jgi:hypothetical protein
MQALTTPIKFAKEQTDNPQSKLLARDDAISTIATKQHATHTHHTACEWNAVLAWHNSNPTGTSFQTCYVRKKASKKEQANKQTWKLHIQLHILPYNVGNKISWVKNYCEVVVVARNPSCCSKSPICVQILWRCERWQVTTTTTSIQVVHQKASTFGFPNKLKEPSLKGN